MRLKDKIIIVTGGNGLLGAEFIKDIRKEGGIAINADISVSTDVKNCEIHTDVTSDNSIEQTVDLVLSEFKRIDGLVNSAYPRTPDWGNSFEDFTPECWRKNLDMQLTSYFVFCQAVLKHMKSQKSGSIVNIASIYGVVGPDFGVYKGTNMTNGPGYAAIKGGLINLTRYLASCFGKYGIRANCVSPGGIFDNQNPVFVNNYEEKTPLGRMGTPGDIAPAVSFLLSDAAGYITGHNLMVDGGWTAI